MTKVPFLFVGVHLVPEKIDNIKLYDIDYNSTTSNQLKEKIIDIFKKKSSSIKPSDDNESREKKFKAEDQPDPLAEMYTPFDKLTIDDIDLIYRGKRFNGDSTISSYDVKDYIMVHVFLKDNFFWNPPDRKEDKIEEADLKAILLFFHELVDKQEFTKEVLSRLRKPEHISKLLELCPSLNNDPVSLAIIQDPDLLMQITTDVVAKVIEKHPALARSVKHVISILSSETAPALPGPSSSAATTSAESPSTLNSSRTTASSSQNSNNSPFMSGDEDMEYMSSSTPRSPRQSRITQDQVAAALAAAVGGGNSQSQAEIMRRLISDLAVPTTPSPSNSVGSSNMPSPAVQQPPHSILPLPSQPIMDQFIPQMQQMRELGLSDESTMLQALQITNGDVTAAINLVFNGTLSGTQ